MMKKTYLVLILLLLFTDCTFAHETRSPERFRTYSKQQYIDKETGEIVQPLFKSPHERNHYVSEKWFCVQPEADKPGYLYVKYTTGRVVKQYQTDNYSLYEPIKCDKRYDEYTNVKSVEEASNYVFNEETLQRKN